MDALTFIVHKLLNFQISLKIYHWQTTSYSRHKATDNLYERISDKIDKFVETLQGSRGTRAEFTNKCNIKLNNFSDVDGKNLLLTFKTWLENDLAKLLDKKETDLINIRDDMLGDVNQTLYLFTLN